MVVFYTDGACTVGAHGGWGCISPDKNIVLSGGSCKTTNNEMELFAIYMALKYCLDNDCPDIKIYTDSAYCIGVFTEWACQWKVKNWQKKGGIKNLQIIKEAYEVFEKLNDKGVFVDFVKVKGHSGDEYNERVDAIAVDAKNQIIADNCIIKECYIVKEGDFNRFIFLF